MLCLASTRPSIFTRGTALLFFFAGMTIKPFVSAVLQCHDASKILQFPDQPGCIMYIGSALFLFTKYLLLTVKENQEQYVDEGARRRFRVNCDCVIFRFVGPRGSQYLPCSSLPLFPLQRLNAVESLLKVWSNASYVTSVSLLSPSLSALNAPHVVELFLFVADRRSRVWSLL